MADALATELNRRYQDLKGKRDGTFMSDWQYISSYFLPQDSDIQVAKTEGVAGWTSEIYDTTALEAAQTLKTGQYNWLTPPGQVWCHYTLPTELKREGAEGADEATAWLGKASEIIADERSRSNFYSIADMAFLGVSVFATDLMFVEEGKKTLFNYRHAKVGTYVIEEDDEGVVDTTMREFDMTYRQMKQMFSKAGDKIPEKLVAVCRRESGLAKKFKILHCIFPREDSERLPERKDGPNKPIASVYFALDYLDNCIRVSGYEEQPALCQRFAKWGTDSPWGYGPAYLGLPIARQLNYVQQFMDALAELHAYPRVLIPDNLEGDVDLRAGGTTTYTGGGQNADKPEEWATVGDYKMGLEMQEQRREALRDAFMNKAFKLLNSMPLLDKKMTAFEISQRQAEQLGDFTPTLGRRITEFMNPLALREFGIAYRAGRLGQAPDSLMVDLGGGKRGLALPSVQITNRLTDSLRALKNRAREETMQFLMPQVKLRGTEVFDILTEKFNRNYALDAGTPPDELRPEKGKDSVEAIRVARANAQQQQNALAAADQLAAAGKNLEGSPEWMRQQAQQAATGSRAA